MSNESVFTAANCDAQRCVDEAYELKHAISTHDRALILDEIVDVLYFVRKIGVEYGVTSQMVRSYALRKSQLRESGGRDKALEIAMARLISSGSAALTTI